MSSKKTEANGRKRTVSGRSELAELLAVASWQNPKNEKKTNTFWCAKSRMRGNETPGRIVTNFCTGVEVHDVSNFYDCRLWGLSVLGGQSLGFSIDSRRRPYNSRTTVRVCDQYRIST